MSFSLYSLCASAYTQYLTSVMLTIAGLSLLVPVAGIYLCLWTRQKLGQQDTSLKIKSDGEIQVLKRRKDSDALLTFMLLKTTPNDADTWLHAYALTWAADETQRTAQQRADLARWEYAKADLLEQLHRHAAKRPWECDVEPFKFATPFTRRVEMPPCFFVEPLVTDKRSTKAAPSFTTHSSTSVCTATGIRTALPIARLPLAKFSVHYGVPPGDFADRQRAFRDMQKRYKWVASDFKDNDLVR